MWWENVTLKLEVRMTIPSCRYGWPSLDADIGDLPHNNLITLSQHNMPSSLKKSYILCLRCIILVGWCRIQNTIKIWPHSIPSAKLSDILAFLPRSLPRKFQLSERRAMPRNAVHSSLLSPSKDEGAPAAQPELKEWLRISQYASTVRSPRTCRAANLWFFHNLKKKCRVARFF